MFKDFFFPLNFFKDALSLSKTQQDVSRKDSLSNQDDSKCFNADVLMGFFNKGFPRNASPPAPSSTAKFAFQPLLPDDWLDILNWDPAWQMTPLPLIV